MLSSRLEALDTVVAQERRRLASNREQLQRLQKLIADKLAMIQLCELCLQEQSGVVEHIEDMVNAFLSALDDDLVFKFDTAYKADKVTVSGVKPALYNAGTNNRPSEGQRTTASAGLQASFLKMKPELSPTIILDEYFADLAPPIVEGLVELFQALGIRVILTTHQNVSFPTVFEVTKKNKISEVRKL